jgi:hypothetical protein
MRDALRSVIALPDNCVDNRQLVEWTRWVFTQQRGTELSGLSTLLAMVRPPPPGPPPPAEPPLAELEAKHRRLILPILAVLLVVLIIELLVR